MAWRRAGRVAEARRAFGRFEATYPESSRLGEVAYTLGRMHARDGDLEGARRLFERAAEDANPAVRARGLRALAEL